MGCPPVPLAGEALRACPTKHKVHYACVEYHTRRAWLNTALEALASHNGPYVPPAAAGSRRALRATEHAGLAAARCTSHAALYKLGPSGP
jgi:hypothetical protein